MEYLLNILIQDKPSELIRKYKDKIFEIIPELYLCENFEQNNVWHVYDVLEHILHVVDNVPNNINLRLAALFHDIGKPIVYKEDENKIGHFYGHWIESYKIFIKFAKRYNLDDEELNKLKNIFNKDAIKMLFILKKSDLLAQNKKFHYILDELDKQEIKILKKSF